MFVLALALTLTSAIHPTGAETGESYEPCTDGSYSDCVLYTDNGEDETQDSITVNGEGYKNCRFVAEGVCFELGDGMTYNFTAK